jgi:hypothetical protein
MKAKVFVLALTAALFAAAAAAQSKTSESKASQDWIGVWQATLDGQPAATLTLADDNGTLGGTAVFNIVSRNDGQPRVLASQPHVILNLRIDGSTLRFQAKRPDGTVMNFSVVLEAGGTASIHCNDCGSTAPIAGMVKAPLTPQ